MARTRVKAKVKTAQVQDVQLTAMANAFEKALDAYARRHKLLFDALRDAVGFIDRLQANKGEWTVAEVKRIEEIRLLSLGI